MTESEKKPPVAGPVAQKKDPREGFVAPMNKDAYRMALAIINKSEIRGNDAESIVLLKRELARVAGEKPGLPRA